MEEYKSNSHKSRGDNPPDKNELEPVKKKEVRQVASGTVKKKSPVNKLAKIFIPEDVTDVKDWLLYDIFIPAAKNLVLDTVNEALGGRRRSRSTIRGGSSISRTDYREPSRIRSERGTRRGRFDYDDICVPTSAEAHDILDELDELMDQYKVVSLADLYSAAGVSYDYTYNNYGWTDISDARVVRDSEGWILKFPKAMPIT